MDTEPDFSIVTPSFNYATYVRECIESVLGQEGATFEHIIQDAGSTDGTLDILREYPHLKLHVEKDSGMSEGINRGFLKATGKWVMWLNTDDRLLPGALAAIKAFADSRPDADVVYGAWNFIGPDGGVQRSMKALPYSLSMHIWYGTYLRPPPCSCAVPRPLTKVSCWMNASITIWTGNITRGWDAPAKNSPITINCWRTSAGTETT